MTVDQLKYDPVSKIERCSSFLNMLFVHIVFTLTDILVMFKNYFSISYIFVIYWNG